MARQGAFRLNTYLTGKGYKSDYSMGKGKLTLIKGNITVTRNALLNRNYIKVYMNNSLLKMFDITSGPQKAQEIENFKKLVIELG